MAKTAAQITPDELAAYRATAQARASARSESLIQRRERAMTLALRAARLLKERFGVDRVVAFGSLVQRDGFAETSDVDLAVWGLPSELYFRALADIQNLTTDLSVDLVDMNACRPELRDAIERGGKLL